MIINPPTFPCKIDFEYHHENESVKDRSSKECFLEFTDNQLYFKSNYSYRYKDPSDIGKEYAYEDQFHYSVDVFNKIDLKGIFYGYNRYPFGFFHIILEFQGVQSDLCPDIRLPDKELIRDIYKIAHYWKYGNFPKHF